MYELKDAAYWLSVEDYIMSSPPVSGDECFFILWRVVPCVVIGRNQIAEAEIDLAEAGRRHVGITRRNSGGGAVYLDPGAIQYAMIQPYSLAAGEDAMTEIRLQTAKSISRVLRQFGIPAAAEGRNDITAGGFKVSGISQLTRGGWLNTHGTLLYDTDLDVLAKLLKPDSDKFISKAVKSVRRRVANIKPLMPDAIGGGGADSFIPAFETAVRNDAAGRGRPFTDFNPDAGDIAKILKIRENIYANPDHTFRLSPPYAYRAARRFPQGKVEVYADVKNGVVSSCAIRGDFIGGAPVESLENAIIGLPFRIADFSGALCENAVKECLGGVAKADFLDLVFNNDL